jgi:hypothetical protein
MSLRKSPTMTPALLAACRANAQKCTGPRTPQGKARVALNGLQHGMRSKNFLALLARSGRGQEDFQALHSAMRGAILPVGAEQDEQCLRAAIRVWITKRKIERDISSPARRQELFARTKGTLPLPWRMKILRPGWRVTVSIWLRRGRGRNFERVRSGLGWKEGQGRLHVGVTVTASMRHPVLGYPRLEEVPPGVADRVVFAATYKGPRNGDATVSTASS